MSIAQCESIGVPAYAEAHNDVFINVTREC